MTTELLFAPGDKVLLDGKVSTILSWPDNNAGNFVWERPLPGDGNPTETGNEWYSEDSEGNPTGASAIPQRLDLPNEPSPRLTVVPVLSDAELNNEPAPPADEPAQDATVEAKTVSSKAGANG